MRTAALAVCLGVAAICWLALIWEITGWIIRDTRRQRSVDHEPARSEPRCQCPTDCQASDDGYCAHCHSGLYPGF